MNQKINSIKLPAANVPISKNDKSIMKPIKPGIPNIRYSFQSYKHSMLQPDQVSW